MLYLLHGANPIISHERRLFPLKKIVALLLAACLTLGCASALAAGKLTVNQETYTAVAGYSFVGYVFAEVENTGDKNIEFGNGLLEILTADGDPMDSTDIYSMYPSILAPGEKGYVSTLQYVDAAESIEDISDYTLTITGKSTQEEAVARLDSTAAYGVGVNSWGAEEQMVVVTITNNTQETVYDCQVAFALYDAEGKLLLVDADNTYNVGIPAGQSVEVQFTVDEDLAAVWAEQGVTPATAESVAYQD